MKIEKNKPIYRIIVTIPIYIGILYRSYNFKINENSIFITLVYLSMISLDLYFSNKNNKIE